MFMKWVYRLERKHGNFCIHNLMMVIVMGQLLVYLGWDPSKLYNLGGAWDYTGYHPVIIVEHEDSQTDYMLWRADIVDFGLEYLHPVA